MDYVKQECKRRIQDSIKKHGVVKIGEVLRLVGESGFVYGAAVIPSVHVRHPIFVSQGHRISLNTAVALTLSCCKFRVPEPIRQADLRTRDYLRRNPI